VDENWLTREFTENEMATSPQISRVNTERRARCGLDSCTSDTSASDVQPFSKVLVKQFVFEAFFQKQQQDAPA
jgi:hypothetical protein